MRKETAIMATVLVMTIYFGISDYENTSHFNISVVALFACSVLYFMITLFERFKMFKMFNWFTPRPKYPTWDDIPPINLPDPKEYPYMPPTTKPRNHADDGYTVGVDSSGNTIIRVLCNNMTTTLTLNRGSLQQLIRLLEATMEDDEDDVTRG